MIGEIIIAVIFLVNYGYVLSGTNPLTIDGGKNASIMEYKFMVSIHTPERRCGGSIVSPTRVVTATQCVHNIHENEIKVRVGSSSSVEGGEYKSISQKIEHGHYIDAIKMNDISLLRLADSLTYNDSIGAINLPTEEEIRFTPGTVVSVLGFGEMADGSYAEVLQKANLRIMENVLCERQYGFLFQFQFCVSEEDKKLRKGDEGSPAFIGNKLVGIVSWIHTHRGRTFTVLVRVPSYLDFIQQPL